MNDTLLICGASARAAAQSARRAGFSPWAVDLFADEDLRAICPATRVTEYPTGLVAAARSGPPGDWLYTGAIENHPDTIAQISATRRLLGNPPDVLARVRDPFLVADALRAKGLPAPDVARASRDVPRDGSWLRKGIRSAGGTHVQTWTGELDDESARGEVYFQKRIAGEPCSAVFVAARGRAVLLGVTRQLIGHEFGSPGEFQYAGSLGPCILSDQLCDQWNKIGLSLAEAFALQGLFGVDAILSPGESNSSPRVFPVEINPRYTASVEILERAFGIRAIHSHVAACREGTLPKPPETSATSGQYGSGPFAKLILYARRDGCVPRSFVDWAHEMNAGQPWPVIADIPSVGEELRTGKPVVTIFAHGERREELLAALSALQIETLARCESAPSGQRH